MTVREFKSKFPDHIALITEKGERFTFKGNYLATEDPQRIVILEQRVRLYKDVEDVTGKNMAPKEPEPVVKTPEQLEIERKAAEVTNLAAGASMVPGNLMAQIQARQAAATTGVQSSAQLPQATESNTK